MEVMESTLIRQPWGWEYTSESGLKYSIGPVTAEFNVIVDDFEDINYLFDCEALVQSHLVDYVYGDLETRSDVSRIKEWLDWRIERYEKHERTVKFYTNYIARDDTDVLYECYIGTEEQDVKETTKITRSQMEKIAKEIDKAVLLESMRK